jgi:acyl-CoA thioester hydrolase
MPLFHFHHPIEIRYADLDPQGHVNNASFLTYFEQARVNYLIHLGLFGKDRPFLEIGIIIAEATVAFKAPVLFGMDVRVGVCVSRLGNKSMTMEYDISDANGTVYATGSTAIVTFDYNTHATVPVPETWREKILAFEQS